MNDKNKIAPTNAADRTFEIFNSGNNVLGIMANAIHKQATEYGDQYKNILKNEISEYEEAISKLMDIIYYYEMEYVPYGKIKRLSEEYDSIVYRALLHTNAKQHKGKSYDIQ